MQRPGGKKDHRGPFSALPQGSWLQREGELGQGPSGGCLRHSWVYPSCSPWASPGGVSQPGPRAAGALLWVETNQGRCLDPPDLPGPQHSSQNPQGAGRRPRPLSAGPGQCKHGRLLNRKTQWGRSSGDPAGFGLLGGPAGSQPPPEPGPTFSSSPPPARLCGSEDTASVPLAPLHCLPDLECPSLSCQLPPPFRSQQAPPPPPPCVFSEHKSPVTLSQGGPSPLPERPRKMHREVSPPTLLPPTTASCPGPGNSSAGSGESRVSLSLQETGESKGANTQIPHPRRTQGSGVSPEPTSLLGHCGWGGSQALPLTGCVTPGD